MRRRKIEKYDKAVQEKTNQIKRWIFFQRKEPTIFGHIVGMNLEGLKMPKGAKKIDFVFEGTESEALKQVGFLEKNGYNLIR